MFLYGMSSFPLTNMFQDGSNHQPEYDEYVYEIDISSFRAFYNQANQLIYDLRSWMGQNRRT